MVYDRLAILILELKVKPVETILIKNIRSCQSVWSVIIASVLYVQLKPDFKAR